MELGCFDLGLSDVHKEWLSHQGVQLAKPEWQFGLDANSGVPEPFPRHSFTAFAAQIFFPATTSYMHMDADAWVQDWGAGSSIAREPDTG